MITQAPFHVFIVPDGNRRWATANGLKPYEGHAEGYKALTHITDIAWGLGISHLTFWALSQDNIRKRPQDEIDALFLLLNHGVKELKESPVFRKKQIRFRAAGDWRSMLPSKLSGLIETLEQETGNRTGPTFTLLLAYDGAAEMRDAICQLQSSPRHEAHNPDAVRRHLATRFLPDVDLMIRTGGEPHLSGGALMWQMQNAHIHFSETMWPDFTPQHFTKAVEEFKGRSRRLGA